MQASAIVETPYGRLQGVAGDAVHHYCGVPYAQAPVADLRFKLPQAMAPWSGVLDATKPAPVPPQLPSRLGKVTGESATQQDEDCLRLEIWTPARAQQRLPVMVFLHGGGYMTGGGALPCYDGSLLAERLNVVVVNVSYRVGVLGFLPISGVASPNLGMHDQILALRWIRNCIASFGGDPKNVTAVGQSAGAYTAAALLVHETGRELFDRAVLMSAPLGIKAFDLEESTALGNEFLQILGLNSENVNRIYDLPVKALLSAQGELLRRFAGRPGSFDPIFFPTRDGVVIQEDPLEAINAGAGGWCDLIVGVTREEAAAFYFQNEELALTAGAQLVHELKESFGDTWQEELQRIVARRAGSDLDRLADFHSDRAFVEPAWSVGARATDTDVRTYLYQFDWQAATPGIGACHCIDLPFLFGNYDDWAEAPMVAGANIVDLEALGASFRGALINFVSKGDPNGPQLPAWPPYVPGLAVMHFDRVIEARGRLAVSPRPARLSTIKVGSKTEKVEI